MGNKITYHSPSRGLLLFPWANAKLADSSFFFRFIHGDGRSYHCSCLFTVLSSSFDLYVHHWRHCRCRTLQWHFEGSQLPASWPPPTLMDCYHPHCWHPWRSSHGVGPQCSPFCCQIDPRSLKMRRTLSSMQSYRRLLYLCKYFRCIE
jgi:hypothetical protein